MTDHLRRVSARASSASIFNRYRALARTHRSLDEKLDAETGRPAPDEHLIRRIKKRKLLVKDEMAAIERLLDAIGAERALEAEAAKIAPLQVPGRSAAKLRLVSDRVPAA